MKKHKRQKQLIEIEEKNKNHIGPKFQLKQDSYYSGAGSGNENFLKETSKIKTGNNSSRVSPN